MDVGHMLSLVIGLAVFNYVKSVVSGQRAKDDQTKRMRQQAERLGFKPFDQ